MRHVAVVVASLVVLLGAQGAATVRAVPTITPEHLLAALRPQEMPQALPGPGTWWPRFPQFMVGMGDRAPGLRFYVVQEYERVGGGVKGSVVTVVLAYDDDTHATQDFAGRILKNNDRDSVLMDGPRVGAATRYFTRVAASSKDQPYETTLRFHLGRFVARVTVFSPRGYESPSVLAAYAAPIERGVRQLAAGRLQPAALPPRIAALLPPAAAASGIGPVLGSAAAPAEAWALIDLEGNPAKVRDTLRAGGASELGVRQYGLAADREHVVDVTVFPFGGDQAARAWVLDWVETVGKDAAKNKWRVLDVGRVKGPAVFVYMSEFNVYGFQFAKGAIAVDLTCQAPFGKTSSVCEAPVRRLAERWFAALPTR